MDKKEKKYFNEGFSDLDFLIKQIMYMVKQIDLLRSRINNQHLAIIAKEQHINRLHKIVETKEQRVASLVRELIRIKKYSGLDNILRKIWRKLRSF